MSQHVTFPSHVTQQHFGGERYAVSHLCLHQFCVAFGQMDFNFNFKRRAPQNSAHTAPDSDMQILHSLC